MGDCNRCRWFRMKRERPFLELRPEPTASWPNCVEVIDPTRKGKQKIGVTFMAIGEHCECD